MAGTTGDEGAERMGEDGRRRGSASGEGRAVRAASWRLASRLALLGALGLAPAAAADGAAAFELFGKKWFEGDAEAAPVEDPTPYRVRIVGPDPELVRKLEADSDLVQRADKPPSGYAGLIARVRGDLRRLTGTLYEEARYGAVLDATVAGRPLAAVGAFDPKPAGEIEVVVTVRPGREFVFGALTVRGRPDGVETGLVAGEPARASKVATAEERLVRAWKERGNPLVKVEDRRVVADHATGRLDVEIVLAPGPKAAFGRVRVEGAKDVNPELVAGRAGVPAGEPYDPDALRRSAKRLREMEALESVAVKEADALDADGTIPVVVHVGERKPNVIGGGVSISNTEGAAVQGWWAHRNLFGGAETLRLEAGLSRIGDASLTEPDFRIAGRFVKPGVVDWQTDFIATTTFLRENPEAYSRLAAQGSAGLARRFTEHLSGSAALELEQSRIRDVTGLNDYTLAGVLTTVEWDRRDNRLDPTEGFRLLMTARPTYDLKHSTTFAGFRADASAYRALDEGKRVVLAGRVAVATVTAEDIRAVPADRRLFAGGGGSVRGFDYQTLAPRDRKGKLVGGRSLVEASGEVRAKVTETIGVAAFLDAGNAFRDAVPAPGDLRYGAGLGLRYLTGIGPLRLDVAVPLDKQRRDPDFAFYVGLGQAF